MLPSPSVFSLLALLTALPLSFQATADEWKSRSIYQVVTDRFARADGSTSSPCDPGLGQYCGGTWQGLIKQLPYIQGMGFSAIWISPVTLNLMQMTKDLSSYHGYWQQDMYNVNSKFGTMSDLKALSNALHQLDMYLMVDVVVGNMAIASSPSSVDYSVFDPFNQEEYFHSYCVVDQPGNATNTEECWLGDTTISLPDLRNEDDNVAGMLYNWIESLVSNYSVDGIRVDSVVNLAPEFLPGLNKAAGTYVIGEVFDGNTTQFCTYQNLLDGALNYPIYFPLTRAFQNTSGTMSDLVAAINAQKIECKDVTKLGNFLENHDVPRFASFTNDTSLIQNAITFNLMYEGIPVFYYGQEQNYDGAFNPVNREALWLSKFNTKAPLYELTATLNAVRTQAISTSAQYLDYITLVILNDDNNLAMRKGFPGNQIITVMNNMGADSKDYTLTIPGNGTDFSKGDVVTDVVSCTNITAGSNGDLDLKISQGAPMVLYLQSGLKGTEICASGATGYGNGGGSGSGSPTKSMAKRWSTPSNSFGYTQLAVGSLLCSLGFLVLVH